LDNTYTTYYTNQYSWQFKTEVLIEVLRGRRLQVIADTMNIKKSHIQAWLSEWHELCGFNVYRFLYNSNIDCFFSKNTDLVYCYADKKGANLYGYEPREIIGKDDVHLRWKGDIANGYRHTDC